MGSAGRAAVWLAAAVLALAWLAAPREGAAYQPPGPRGGYADEVFFYQTTDLLLAYSATSNTWYPLALEGQELIRGAKFSGQVIVVATTVRILGFSSLTNRWREVEAIPNEEFLEVFARDNVGVVRTSKRVLGFSALTGDWSQLSLDYTGGGGY